MTLERGLTLQGPDALTHSHPPPLGSASPSSSLLPRLPPLRVLLLPPVPIPGSTAAPSPLWAARPGCLARRRAGWPAPDRRRPQPISAPGTLRALRPLRGEQKPSSPATSSINPAGGRSQRGPKGCGVSRLLGVQRAPSSSFLSRPALNFDQLFRLRKS